MIDKRMFIVNASPMMILEIGDIILRGGQGGFALNQIGFFLVFTAPIMLKPGDKIWVDTRNGRVELVQRDFMMIWRSNRQN